MKDYAVLQYKDLRIHFDEDGKVVINCQKPNGKGWIVVRGYELSSARRRLTERLIEDDIAFDFSDSPESFWEL